MSPAARRRVVVTCTLIVIIVGVSIAGVIEFRRAHAKARELQAYCRLGQLGLALQMYEDDHGTLPPLHLRDNLGTPIHSWRAFILPYLGSGLVQLSKQLDLTRPWNSDANRRLIDSVPSEDWLWWTWPHSEVTQPPWTHALALVGRRSIWEPGTGLPKGKISEHPGAILLLWVPRGNLHPLQPGDITEKEVRERIEQGEQVLFITARGATSDGGIGVVTLEGGELVFQTLQQILDRREGRQ